MFWKPTKWEQRQAKRAGEQAHRALFPISFSFASDHLKVPGKAHAVNRWNGAYDYPKPKGLWSDLFKEVRTYKERLKKRGFVELGSGAFSAVYGKPGCSTVVKVCHAGETDPWPLFAAWAHANPSPFVPVIHSFKRHKGFYVAVIERMDRMVYNAPKELGHDRAVGLFRDYIETGEPCVVLEATMSLYPGIKDVLDGMRAEFDGKANWDLHKGNWMVRADNSLVITDPISEGGYSAEKATKVTRIKGSRARLAA